MTTAIRLSAHLSPTFFSKGVALCAKHGWNFLHLLAVMLSESGVHADAVNHANPTAGACGLIQFMPNICAGLLGLDPKTQAQTARTRVLAMNAEQQLDLVEKFFAPFARFILDSPARFYQATFLPATLGRGSAFGTVITGSRQGDPFPFAYPPNIGFDIQLDAHRKIIRDGNGSPVRKGFITVGDLQQRIEIVERESPAYWEELQGRAVDAGASPGGGPGIGAVAVGVVGVVLAAAAAGFVLARA